MSEYNMPLLGLFGKRCRIPHVSDKERGFVYRIVNSGIRSNVWKEPPLGRYYNDSIQHDHMEDVLIVVCDTLIDENSKLEKVALKDVVIMDETDKSVLEKIKNEIDKLDFDFGDFYDHTASIHEMIDEVWNKHVERNKDEDNTNNRIRR